MIPNILAQRYASQELIELFEPVNRVKIEREFWVEVLKLQIKYGFKVDSNAVKSYSKSIESIDLTSIEQRELVTKHDVKARIEEFNALAGYEVIHVGLTSRDLTDNIELIQIKKSLEFIQAKLYKLLNLCSEKIEEYKNLYMVGRTHNVPAQITTLGKKISIFAQELLMGYENLTFEVKNLHFRGIKGAIGSKQDLLNLFDLSTIEQIEKELAEIYGFEKIFDSVGQVYPRSQDFSFISKLILVGSGINSFAINIRLMSGIGLVQESFLSKQTGSSAMPHKINPRSSERINGLMVLLRGYLSMASEITGNQWNEGDVSCSVVRRVILPDSIFAVDGIINTMYKVLQNLEVNKAVIDNELISNIAFLASSEILMRLVKKGVGREKAHGQIRDAANMAKGNQEIFISAVHDIFSDVISKEEIESILTNYQSLSGSSITDCEKLIQKIKNLKPINHKSIEFDLRF